MAREIIGLNVAKTPDILVSCVFWLIAPANLVQPNPNVKSLVPPVSATYTWGITAAELALLQAGTTIEQAISTQFTAGSGQAAILAGLQAMYTAAQAALTASAPATRYAGASWDGTTWTAAP